LSGRCMLLSGLSYLTQAFFALYVIREVLAGRGVCEVKAYTPLRDLRPLTKGTLLMRRTILLLATASLVLLLVGGVAASKQREDQSTTSSESPTTTTDKSGGDVSIESTTQKASFTNGSGANYLRVAVSDHGNLTGFESPFGIFQNSGGEGYALCSNAGATVHGYDVAGSEAGFGTPTFAQPNGAGTFPLTVTRNTTDGKFKLTQVWATPDAGEKDVTVTMTVKNLSSSTINNVFLSRGGDFDVGNASSDRGALTGDSAFLWDDRIGPTNQAEDTPATGLQLTALTFATSHGPDIDTLAHWVTGDAARYKHCDDFTELTPTGRADLAMRVVYKLGNLSAQQSKTVKYEYGRM
jgi:hypothetical protein